MNGPVGGPEGWVHPSHRIPLWRRFLKFVRELSGPRRVIVGVVIVALVAGGLYLHLRHVRTATPPFPPPPAEHTQRSPDLALPEDLGGHVSSASLLKLLDAAHRYNFNRGQLRLNVRGRGGVHPPIFPVGKPFEVRISCAGGCYCALIHHNSDGTFQLLFPALGGREASGRLRAGVIEKLTVQATPPGGEQEFLLIGARRPIDLESILAGAPETYREFLSVVTFPYVAPEEK